ncbi:MAG: hypothetical protein FD157_3685 [Rhodocyclaceae bacterium]|nr:MAG: hypothetical protein FD157_3685 [Rhodocyclaceae bacterium]
MDRVQTVSDEQGRETTDTRFLTQALQRRIEADPVAGLGDLLDLDKYAGMELMRQGWTGMDGFGTLMKSRRWWHGERSAIVANEALWRRQA